MMTTTRNFTAKVLTVLLAVCGMTNVAEAYWRQYWESGWWVHVANDETGWDIRCYRETPTDGDGNALSIHTLHQIIACPEGGGDLDMSTMWEDIQEHQPTVTIDKMPQSMQGNFYQEIQAKHVTSIKLPTCMRTVSGWSASGATPYYNSCTTNVVLNRGLNKLGGGFLSYMTNLVSVSGLDDVRHIGDNAFLGCTKLKTIDPYLPTGVVTIATSAFNQCNALTGDLNFRSPYYRKINVRPGKPTSVIYNNSVTNINASWDRSYSLAITNIVFPADLETIPRGISMTPMHRFGLIFPPARI